MSGAGDLVAADLKEGVQWDTAMPFDSLPDDLQRDILLWGNNPILAVCSVGDGGATHRPFYAASHDSTTVPSFERYVHERIVLPHEVQEALSFFPADRELYLPSDWTIMSIDEMRRLATLYAQNGQLRVQPFALRYEGMGHISVFACDPQTMQTFVYPDGGSNGYDRQDNFIRVIAFQDADIAARKADLSNLWASTFEI